MTTLSQKPDSLPSLRGPEIDASLILLASSLLPPEIITHRVNFILRIVSIRLHVPIAEIRGKSRVNPIVWARQVAMSLCRDILNLKKTQIAPYFECSPSAVCYNVATAEGYSLSYPQIREMFDKLESEIVSGLNLKPEAVKL